MQTQSKRYMWILMASIWIVGLMAGCAKVPVVIPPETPSVTDWRQESSGAYILNQDRLFYGIGRAAGSQNPTLLRATADTQAQQEMARVLDTYFGRLISAAGWQGDSDERQQIIYGLSQSALQKARITDHRFDDQNKTLFALCSLPLDTLEQTLQNSPFIGTTLKKEMLSRTEDVHQQWAAAQ